MLFGCTEQLSDVCRRRFHRTRTILHHLNRDPIYLPSRRVADDCITKTPPPHVASPPTDRVIEPADRSTPSDPPPLSWPPAIDWYGAAPPVAPASIPCECAAPAGTPPAIAWSRCRPCRHPRASKTPVLTLR